VAGAAAGGHYCSVTEVVGGKTLARRRLVFRILGPLEVEGDDGPLALVGRKQRALLALLLLHPGEVVSSDRLVDELWGEDPPATAATSLRNLVAQLRKLLGAETIVTRPSGYLLAIEPDSLDSARFERLLAQARKAQPREKAILLREALALWRGPPLADLAFERFAQGEVHRLEELRMEALEQRLEAELALGQGAELVAELETLVQRHLLRERFRAQLMLALYRGGRQAEALEAYHAARRTLVEELGVAPSRELQQLYGAILRQEPTLAPTRTPEPINRLPPAQPTPFLGRARELAENVTQRRADLSRGTRRHRRRLAVAAGAVVAAGAALVGLLFASGRDDRGATVTQRSLTSIFGPPGRVHPPGYRVALAERLTSGAGDAHPRLGLVADIDTGIGNVEDHPPQRATGEVVFHLDVRQINHVSKTVPAPGTQDLLLAAKGTQIGYAAFGPGPPTVQNRLIKEGTTTDPETREPVVHVSIGVPRVFVSVLGTKYPMTIRVGAQQLVLTLNVQRLVFAFRSKRGEDVAFNSVGLYFSGTYSGFRGRSNSAFFATNPERKTLLGASVSARPCIDAACAKLGPAATDSIRFTLPKAVSVHAPAHVLYGQRARFTGTGPPGDSIALAYQLMPRSAPVCTPLLPPERRCAPRYAPFWYKLDAPTTTVGADGHWSLATALRPVFGPYASHPATGRYVAVDYVGAAFGGNANGGRFSIFADAPADTEVALARPRIRTRQRGRRLVVSVVVPRGDHFVRLLLRLNGRSVAAGHLDDSGAFSAMLALPRRNGRLEARATVPGAASSHATVQIGRFGPSHPG
jgi:DNA-binding SARP family transcriptional activator